MNDQPKRRLNWPGCMNVRELGGYPLSNGGETRWSAVVRADGLSRLEPAGEQALLDYGVTTIIDLRGPDEISKVPHPFAGGNHNGRVRYLSLPVIDDDNARVMDRVRVTDSTAEVYCLLLEGFASRFAAVLRAILEAPPGVVLFHCYAGKDRTGMIAALLLDLAGVDRETIIADYALTDPYIEIIYAESMLEAPADPIEREKYRARMNAHPDKMAGFIDFVHARYRGTAGFLREYGWTEAEIAALAARLTGAGQEQHGAD